MFKDTPKEIPPCRTLPSRSYAWTTLFDSVVTPQTQCGSDSLKMNGLRGRTAATRAVSPLPSLPACESCGTALIDGVTSRPRARHFPAFFAD